MQFYLTLHGEGEKELARHDFSEEEIAEGFADVKELYGMEDVISL